MTRALPAGMKRAWPIPPGLVDGIYHTVSRQVFEFLLTWDWTNQAAYVAEHMDCDNFAEVVRANFGFRLGINSVGMVLDSSSYHAYNLVIFSDGSFRWLEPQTDKWVDIGFGLYKCQTGVVLM